MLQPGACWTSVPIFMEILQAVKMWNSISRERLSFRRRPILCTTLYRNPIQANNFGGTFDNIFLWIFVCNFHTRCLSTFSIPWCKKVKMTKNSNEGGGSPAKAESHIRARNPSPTCTVSQLRGYTWTTVITRVINVWPESQKLNLSSSYADSKHRATESGKKLKKYFWSSIQIFSPGLSIEELEARFIMTAFAPLLYCQGLSMHMVQGVDQVRRWVVIHLYVWEKESQTPLYLPSFSNIVSLTSLKPSLPLFSAHQP